jgi:hypothetical protein
VPATPPEFIVNRFCTVTAPTELTVIGVVPPNVVVPEETVIPPVHVNNPVISVVLDR